jgi:hypothetical protein
MSIENEYETETCLVPGSRSISHEVAGLAIPANSVSLNSFIFERGGWLTEAQNDLRAGRLSVTNKIKQRRVPMLCPGRTAR